MLIASAAVTSEQVLTNLLREDSQFTAPILESLSSLHLDTVLEKEVVELVTSAVASSRAADLPAIIRFLLQHLTTESAPPITAALRTGLSLEFLSESGGGGGHDRHGSGASRDAASETLVLDAILSALRLRSDLGGLLLSQLEAIKRTSDHKSIDWWLITALSIAGDTKCRTRTVKLLNERATKGMLKPVLMRAAISGHGVALRPHYAVQLSLAAGLVRASSSANARSLGCEIYALLFAEFEEPYERQELICQVLTHVGAGVVAEVDAALRVLVDLAITDAAGVAQFSSFITGILDYLDGLTVPQARLAFEVFARIAFDASGGGSRLADELQITIRKQMTSTAPRYKSLGVLGGCCLLGRLGARSMSTTVQGEARRMMDGARREEAEKLLHLMLRYASAPDGSFGFLLHELSLLVAARSPPSAGAPRGAAELEHELIEVIIDRITSNFDSEYLHDVEALPVRAARIQGIEPCLALSLDGCDATIAVNILPLLRAADEPASHRHALCTLSATFQLLRVCEAAISTDGNALEAVDAVLGCPLYLFDSSELHDFESRPQSERETICLALFYTVDWLRELVNAFCTQREHEMRKKVLARLKQLLWMERSLDHCLALTPSFRLPAAVARPEDSKPKTTKTAGGGSKGKAISSKGGSKAFASKGKAKAKPPPKKKARIGSDVDSDSDGAMGDTGVYDDGGVTLAEADVAMGPGNAGTSMNGGAAESVAGVAKKAGPKPTTALPNLTALAKVLPYLRALTVDACMLLTFTKSLFETPESEDLELNELLTAPSVHYLITHLNETLKRGLSSAPVFPTSTAPANAASGGGSAAGRGLASMELARLRPSGLLQRLRPALMTFRRHAKTLSDMVPTVLDLPSYVSSHDAAFGGGETEDDQLRFVEPTVLLMMQAIRRLLESKQFTDDEGQVALLSILASFSNDDADGVVHVSVSQHADRVEGAGGPCADQPHGGMPRAPIDAVAACCSAFDFFESMFCHLPSITLQSEVVGVCTATLELMLRHAGSSHKAQIDERREQLANLASACLQRERADDRELKDWQEKPPNTALVTKLFQVQASYCSRPVELLLRWTNEYLPELQDLDVTAGFEIDGCPLFTKKTAPHFIGVLFGMLIDEVKRIAFPKVAPAAKAAKTARVASAMDHEADHACNRTELDDEVAAEVIRQTHELSSAFVSLVQVTKVVDFKKKDGTSTSVARALNKKAIVASSQFVKHLLKHALPLMSSHFCRLSDEVIACLKAVQPATRLLQVHCTMVKERQQLAALQPAAILKRELESLVFHVKLLLKSNNCHEGFWMGNLKHKALAGHEVSSQMAVEAAEPKETKGTEQKERKRKKGGGKEATVAQTEVCASQIQELDGEEGECVDMDDEGDDNGDAHNHLGGRDDADDEDGEDDSDDAGCDDEDDDDNEDDEDDS